MKIDETFDFGFSIIDEKDIKQYEEKLKQDLIIQEKLINKTTAAYQNKLHTLRDMIMPLLNNLSKDPEKSYIFWPNRSEKIKEFIEKMNKFIETQ